MNFIHLSCVRVTNLSSSSHLSMASFYPTHFVWLKMFNLALLRGNLCFTYYYYFPSTSISHDPFLVYHRCLFLGFKSLYATIMVSYCYKFYFSTGSCGLVPLRTQSFHNPIQFYHFSQLMQYCPTNSNTLQLP